jgi:transposase-like protein
MADRACIARIVSDTRFSRGVYCVRCGSRQVIGWGRYRARDRYRCRECGRTFNALTNTPFSYSKRLECWLPYLRLMRGQTTLRRAAARLGLHLSTSFRWRHRLLDSPGAFQIPLSGHIEFAEALFAYSEKGNRRLNRPAYVRGGYADKMEWQTRRRVRVLLLRGRDGTAAGQVWVDNVPVTAHILETLTRLVAPPAVIVMAASRMSPFGAAVTRSGHELCSLHRNARPAAPTALLHMSNVVAFERRLRRWLLPFRGVATRYLKNYLAWHRFADHDDAAAWEFSFLGWTAAACDRHANNSGEQSAGSGVDPHRLPGPHAFRGPCACSGGTLLTSPAPPNPSGASGPGVPAMGIIPQRRQPGRKSQWKE